MLKIYSLFFSLTFLIIACTGDDPVEIPQEPPKTMVNFDINAVPYSKLPRIHFLQVILKIRLLPIK